MFWSLFSSMASFKDKASVLENLQLSNQLNSSWTSICKVRRRLVLICRRRCSAALTRSSSRPGFYTHSLLHLTVAQRRLTGDTRDGLTAPLTILEGKRGVLQGSA